MTQARILIAGAGLTALAAALALDRCGANVVVLGAHDRDHAPGDRRPIALSKSSQRVLMALGVWPHLEVDLTPIKNIVVSEAGRFAKVRLHATDVGSDAFGYVVDAGAIAVALRATLTNNNVQLENIRAVEQVTTTDDGVTCDVDRGDGTDKFNADLLIAADGGESSLRDLLGIGERVRDYAQVALSAIVKAAKPVAMTAFERFTPDGPLALLPMRDDCYGLVWCMAPDQASKLVGGTSSQIEGALEVRSGAALGKLELQSPPVCFPLKAIRANSNIADRCVLLGDAAHQLHPVAGQGLNLGLRDVADLAERLSVALRDGIDIGDAAHLGAYARARRADQRRVFRATDSLVRIFSSSILPLGLARQSAMLAMQMSPALKKRFALAAMGLEPPVSAMVGGAL